MKNLIVLFCFILFGCAENINQSKIIPDEYFFSKDKSDFHYIRIGSIRQVYKINKLFINNNSKKYVVTSFLDNEIFDSLELDKNFKINYLYIKNPFDLLENKIYKAEIGKKSFEISTNKKAFEFSLYINKNKIIARQEEEFISDTIIKHDGLPLKCLITETITTFKKNNLKKIVKKRNYWTKEFGLIMFKSISNNETIIWYQTFSQ